MALIEALEDAAIHTGRILTGMSKSLAVTKHVRDRWAKGELFNFAGSGVKFSTTGKIMVAGWGIQNAVSSAYEGYTESKLGTPSGEMLSATPKPTYTKFYGDRFGNQQASSASEEAMDYINEANYYNSSVDMGATGDLVFAMNANRRG